MRVEKTIFISYRRANIYHARAVHQALTQRGYDVFLDFESIDSGSFERIILNQIDARAHFLLILTPSALERCGDPNDWLRREIERAIEMQRNIVPLMFDTFDFAHAKPYLHGNLTLLPEYNGLSIPPDFFEEAMDRLIGRYLNKPLDMVLHPTPPDQEAIAERKQADMLDVPTPDPQAIVAQQQLELGITRYYNGQFNEAIEAFSTAIRLKPDLAEAYYRRGHVYRFFYRFETTLENWEIALRLAADDDPYLPMYRSAVHRMKGEYDQALAAANTAIELNPTDPEMHKNRGDIHSDMGDFDAAITDHTRAIDLNPQYSIGYNNRGLAHAAQGDLDAAIADYNEAIRLNPEDAVSYNNRGLARAMQGDFHAAIMDYDEAIRLSPQHVGAYFNRGYAYGALGDFPAAIADYNTVLQIDPHNSMAYNNRGYARFASGDVAGGFADYDTAIQVNPQNAGAYFNRGVAYGQQNNPAAAIADFTTVLQLDPHNSMAYNNRGVARFGSGDFEGAIADYEAAVRADPNNQQAQQNLANAKRTRGGWLSNLFGG